MAGIDPLRHNRASLFWVLHSGGWAAYVISQLLGAMLYEKMTGYPYVIVIAAISGFFLSLTLRYICRWLWRKQHSPRVMIAVGLLSCYTLALIWRVIINLAYQHFLEPEWEFKTMFEIFAGAVSASYLYLCWTRASISASSTTNRCSSSARRRCGPRRWRRKPSSRCCATSSTRTSCSTR